MKDLQNLVKEIEDELKEFDFVDKSWLRGKVTKEKAVILFKPREGASEGKFREFCGFLSDKTYIDVILSINQLDELYDYSFEIKICCEDGKISEKEERVKRALTDLKKYIQNYKLQK